MKETDDKIVILGCGGHSRSVADVVLSLNPHVQLVFVDDNARENEKIYGFDVFREYPVDNNKYFIAIGDNETRKSKLEQVGEKYIVSIISHRAHRGINSKIGAGCFVGNYCHIGPDAVVGKNTIINTASLLEHEVIVGDHCHIGPNATVSGRCIIGDLVFVGVGATIIDKVTICSNVIIGAGATVVKDISEPGIYVGTPTRRIK